jgi:capsular exopolysaccharide synthesis family protein
MDSINPTPPARTFGSIFGVKFYRYRNLLRRQWWMLGLTIGLGLAWQSWVLFEKPNLHESTSELSVPEEVKGLQDKQLFSTEYYDQYVGNTLRTLQSPEVIDAAKRRLELEVPNLTSRVTIAPAVVPRTTSFSVTGRGTNPDYTRRFVDAVTEEFIAYRKSQRKGQLTETTGDLKGELDGVRKKLAAQKAEFQTFIEQNDMTAWKEQAATSGAFLSGLKTQQAQLEHDLLRLQNLTPDQLLLSTPHAPAKTEPVGFTVPNSNPKAEGGFGGNELYTQYLQKSQSLVQKQADLEERSTIWKPAHPKLQALQREVEGLQRQIDVIKRQTAEATASRIDAIKNDLKSLEVSIAASTEKMNEASRKDSKYNSLQSEITRTQQQEDNLLADLTKVSTKTGLDSGLPTIQRHATQPIPVPRGTAQHLILGLLSGLALGGLVLFLLDRSDDRLASSTEVIEHFSEPIIGQIPDVADSRGAAGLPLLQPEDERYTYAEAFRSLRSSLIFMPNQAEMKTLLVTSAIPNEGKSTIASNLAITMAASGARVLLVDADLRRGDVAQLFEIDGRIGLTNVLRGEHKWTEALRETKYSTLSVIARGPVTNQSGELLLKPLVLTLLEEFKDSFDLTIFNTSPILATDDTPTLAPNFDGALMVVRAGFTSAHLTKNALDALYHRQVNVLGLILNAIDTEMPDYYYYRYPKYYAA